MNLIVAARPSTGYILVETRGGTLRLHFTERMEKATLYTHLQLDGVHSTGWYKDGYGELDFQLAVSPPNFARGVYRGTLWLQGSLESQKEELLCQAPGREVRKREESDEAKGSCNQA